MPKEIWIEQEKNNKTPHYIQRYNGEFLNNIIEKLLFFNNIKTIPLSSQ